MSQYDFRMDAGRDKGVLLVHGLTGSPAEMRFVAKRLHREGFTVYAPTMAGHCADEAALLATRYEDWVASVRAAIRRFAEEVKEIYVAGICVGGAVGLLAAELEPGLVKGAAIYSPLLNYDGWNVPFYYPWARRLMPFFRHTPGLRRISFGEAPPYGLKSERIRRAVVGNGEGIEGTLPKFPLLALNQHLRLNDALVAGLPGCRVPTLLIHAREDDVCHPRNAEKIQQLHGGRCEVAYLDDSYHMIHVDQQRYEVARLTGEFFGMPPAAQMQEPQHG